MKVRANATYRYNPVPLDKINPPYGQPKEGDIVRVVNLPGCPKCNTMNHCHIEHPDTGEFLGMVCCNSLQPK